jgi:methylthioribose-1-phosphate isomerase
VTPEGRHTRAALALIEEAHALYDRGWMPGTAGNLSLRTSAQGEPLRVAITASGVHKGRLRPEDVLAIDERWREWPASSDRRPSAETCIHWAIYQAVPRAGAVFHVHTIPATLLSQRTPKGYPSLLEVSDVEMIKGLGLWDPEAVAQIPVFANWPIVDRIADDIAAWLANGHALPGLIIRGHGVTAWGCDADEARKHLEVIEFLCALIWESKKA